MRAALWLVTLAGTGVALVAAGRGPLAGPPLSADVLDWVSGRSPATVALAVGRLVALAAVAHLLAVSLLALVAGTVRGADAAAHALAGPLGRRLLRVGMGVGLQVAVALPAPTSAAAEARTPVVALTDAEPAAPGTAWMRPTTPSPAETPAHPDTEPAEPAPSQGAPRTWEVRSGDSFWSIAETLLRERTERPPSAAEVAPFWRRLVEVNRHRLVDPDDADLILPGQVLVIPRTPPTA